MKLTQNNREDISKLYDGRLKRLGCTPATVGWNRGKQWLRFEMLFKTFEIENSRILDIGCGLGDLVDFLYEKSEPFKYTGIDLTKSFIEEAEKKHKQSNVRFIYGDFLEEKGLECDVAVCSGAFNYRLKDQSNLDVAFEAMKKAFDIADVGIAFNFLSKYVDYQVEEGYYYDPADILNFSYSLSRNVVLWSNYMPFEFTVAVLKDDSYTEELVFRRCQDEML